MSKKSVSPSGEQAFTFVFLLSIIMAVTFSLGRSHACRFFFIFHLSKSPELLAMAHKAVVSIERKFDFTRQRLLKSLFNLDKLKEKQIGNPFNFQGASKMTTFVRSAGRHTY